MPRLVHLAPASRERAITKNGIRGARWDVLTARGKIEVARAVFAMPVLRDFSATHQWLRELRRWHGEKMIAVHLVVPSTELVLVGRYGHAHARLPLSEAIARVMAEPVGAEIVVPRSIAAREVVAVRELTQLVGWTRTPERALDCVCVACLPPGDRALMRRVRAAYEHGLTEARRHADPDAIAEALGGLEVPLERARGRIAPTKLVGYARSPHAVVRAALAHHLAMFRRKDAEPTLLRLLADEDDDVSAAAAVSLLRLLGPARALASVSTASLEARMAFVRELSYPDDPVVAVSVLERLRGSDPSLDARIRGAARAILKDELAGPLAARLEHLLHRDPHTA